MWTPWWLVSDGARLTLVGYCHGARAKRRFRLERISALSLGGQARKGAQNPTPQPTNAVAPGAKVGDAQPKQPLYASALAEFG